MNDTLSRRSMLCATGSALVSACAPAVLTSPFSSGSTRPLSKIPAKACDSHIHIITPDFEAQPRWRGEKLIDASVTAYRQFQKLIGTERVVVVTPSTYGDDNRATLDALRQFGKSSRGVVVIDCDAPPPELKSWTALGVRGIRMNFVSPQPWGKTDAARLEKTARIAADLGWHIQIYAKGSQIAELDPVLSRLPTPVVIDHFGSPDPAEGLSAPGIDTIRRRLASGTGWMKLSGPYISTKSGPPEYADLMSYARAYVSEAPERLVWGSDWPHRGQTGKLPDDANLIDHLALWAPDEKVRHRILVENPGSLYRF